MRIIILTWYYKEYVLGLANGISRLKDTTLVVPEDFRGFCDQFKSEKLKLYILRDLG